MADADGVAVPFGVDYERAVPLAVAARLHPRDSPGR
jgi:hypothetical protein